MSKLAQLLSDHPLAIDPRKLQQIEAFVRHRLAGGSSGEPQAAGGPRGGQAGYQQAGSVAVLRVFGTVAQRMNLLSNFSGGTSTELLARDLRAALADPSVETILLQIDSPGGSVYGVQELADEIYQARDRKRIVAHADALAASAAYWLGSQASEFIVTPSGEVGSIGVVAMHVDYSKMLENDGVAVTYIHAGEKKVEGNPYQPLEEEAFKFQLSRVNDYYRQFVSAVARGRGVNTTKVLSSFGQGRVYGADQALSVGMVDRVEPFDTTITALIDQPRAKRQARARAAMATVSEGDRSLAEAYYLSAMGNAAPESYFEDPIMVQIWRDLGQRT